MLLDVALAGVDAAEVVSAIGILFASFGGQNDPQTVAGLIKIYVQDVKAFPAWAVERAVRKYMRAEIPRPNHAFAPSLAELVKAIQDEIRPFRLERWEINKALNARVER